jgi:hypothetical protein
MVDPGAHSGRMEEKYPAQFRSSNGLGHRTLELLTPLTYSRLEGDPPKGFVAKAVSDTEKRVAEHYEQASARLAESLGFFPCSRPNGRMAAQQGWFSCASAIDMDHGEAIASSFSRAEHRSRSWCRRIIIDASAKCGLLRDLWRMNITGETVYCGLDGLGRAMTEAVDLLNPTDCHFELDDGLLTARAHLEDAPLFEDPPRLDDRYFLSRPNP